MALQSAQRKLQSVEAALGHLQFRIANSAVFYCDVVAELIIFHIEPSEFRICKLTAVRVCMLVVEDHFVVGGKARQSLRGLGALCVASCCQHPCCCDLDGTCYLQGHLCAAELPAPSALALHQHHQWGVCSQVSCKLW